jgi:HNH endonuclease/AP2 domain
MSPPQLQQEIQAEPAHPYRLPLRARDGSVRAWAVVDQEDFDHVNQWRWSLSAQGYACRKKGGRKGTVVTLHRELFELTKADRVEVDHINRDKLDNRRANLRVVPRGTQPQNTDGRSDRASRFRGVTPAAGSRWRAQVGMRNDANVEENFSLGTYDLEEDAAAAAAQWRHEHFPFANEDPALLARKVNRRQPKRLLDSERQQLAILELSTTLSRRQMEDMTDVSMSTIRRAIGGISPRERSTFCVHHEACSYGAR